MIPISKHLQGLRTSGSGHKLNAYPIQEIKIKSLSLNKNKNVRQIDLELKFSAKKTYKTFSSFSFTENIFQLFSTSKYW
jgi:hypothetical protein